jgi:hypothetical protein
MSFEESGEEIFSVTEVSVVEGLASFWCVEPILVVYLPFFRV